MYRSYRFHQPRNVNASGTPCLANQTCCTEPGTSRLFNIILQTELNKSYNLIGWYVHEARKGTTCCAPTTLVAIRELLVADFFNPSFEMLILQYFTHGINYIYSVSSQAQRSVVYRSVKRELPTACGAANRRNSASWLTLRHL